MSLMTAFKSGCCCCNNVVPDCNCLASSISVIIPAWSYGSYSCPAQTVIAYKCCFTYGDDIFVYRATAINIGSTYSAIPQCTTFALNTYFIFYIYYSNQINNCAISVEARIITEGSFHNINVSPYCFACLYNPLVIDATTACYGILTNNLCTFTNTFMTTNHREDSWFSNATNCTPLIFACTDTGVELSTVVSAKSNSSCSKPNELEVNFNNTTIFTMTIS